MPDLPLLNQVALVTGATRGTGRGIARMLGAAGATVYCTGRSVRGQPATPGRPESIEETAELVTAEGGRGIAVRTDHTVESEVESLFARIREEQDRLDILVNDIWGGDELTEWGKPFWELDSTTRGLQDARAGCTHPYNYQPSGRADHDRTQFGARRGSNGRRFDGISNEPVLRPRKKLPRSGLDMRWRVISTKHNITALTVTPGFLRSEAMLDGFGVTEANWRDAIAEDSYFAESETPCYMGRGVAALAVDPNIASKSGGLYSSGSLAREYGFTDLDGRRPDWGRYFPARVQEIVDKDERPEEMSLYVVRARLHQIELDPAAKEEVQRFRAYLDRYG